MSRKARPSQMHCDYLELDGIFQDHVNESSDEEKANLNGLADELKERYKRLLISQKRMNEHTEVEGNPSANDDRTKEKFYRLKENLATEYWLNSAETKDAEHQGVSNYTRKFVRKGKFGCNKNEYELLPQHGRVPKYKENKNYNSEFKIGHGTEQKQTKSSERLRKNVKNGTLGETKYSVSSKVKHPLRSSNLERSAVSEKTNNASIRTHRRMASSRSRERPDSTSMIPSPIGRSAERCETKHERSYQRRGLERSKPLSQEQTAERQMTRRIEVDSRNRERSTERKSTRSRTISPEDRIARRQTTRTKADPRQERSLERIYSRTRSRTLSPQERSAGRAIRRTEAGPRQERSVERKLTRSRAVSPDPQSSRRQITRTETSRRHGNSPERKSSGSRPSSRQEESVRKHITRTAAGARKDTSLERKITRSRTVSPEEQRPRRQRTRSEATTGQERSLDRKVTRSRTLSPQERSIGRLKTRIKADYQPKCSLERERKGTNNRTLSPQERSAGRHISRSRTLSPNDRDSERQNISKRTLSAHEDDRERETSRSRAVSPHQRHCPLYESSSPEPTTGYETLEPKIKSGRRKVAKSNEVIARKVSPGANVRVYNNKTAERILPNLQPERKHATREVDNEGIGQTMARSQDARPDSSYTINQPVSRDIDMDHDKYNPTNYTEETIPNSFDAQSKLYNEAISSEYNTPSAKIRDSSNTSDARQATYIVYNKEPDTHSTKPKEFETNQTRKPKIRHTIVQDNKSDNGNALGHETAGLRWDHSEDEESEADQDNATMQDPFGYAKAGLHLFRPYDYCKREAIRRSGWNRQGNDGWTRQGNDRYIDDEETYQQIQEKIFLSGTAVIVNMMRKELERTVMEDFDISFWAATYQNIIDLEMDVDNFSASLNADHSSAAGTAIEEAERRLHWRIDDLLLQDNTAQRTAFSLMVHDDVTNSLSRLKSAAYDLGSRKQMQMLLPEIKQVLLDLRLLTECFSVYGEQFFVMARSWAAAVRAEEAEANCGVLAGLSSIYTAFMSALRTFRVRIQGGDDTGRTSRASTSKPHTSRSDSVHSVHMSLSRHKRRNICTVWRYILALLLGVAFCFLLAMAGPKIVTSFPLLIDSIIRILAAVWGALGLSYKSPGLI